MSSSQSNLASSAPPASATKMVDLEPARNHNHEKPLHWLWLMAVVSEVVPFLHI